MAQITTHTQRQAVQAYSTRAQSRSEIDRLAEGREKTGVLTGAWAVNPVNGERIPIWVADYVVMGYGTGAIMAVPAHDARDRDFAVAYNLPVVPVFIDGVAMIGPFTGESEGDDIIQQIIRWLEEQQLGRGVVNYKLRDWLISRQRYWGTPIPIIHCPQCGEVPVPEDQLPVLLPEVEKYQPTGTGESPLASIPEFVKTTCPTCGGPARRETDTMGGFACSSWYFLRFADPHNTEMPFSREAVDYWLPVDLYVGGAEHAVMHLLYARFWTKVLYDAGLVGFTEPFSMLRNQGMMLARTPGRAVGGEEAIENWKVLRPEERRTIPPEQWVWRWVKMSKSYGNVVTPDEVAMQYGADALRIYELFVAPFEETVLWSEEGIRGAARFLARVWRLIARHAEGFDAATWRATIPHTPGDEVALRRKTHQTIAKVTEDLENFRFNTAVAALMEWVNAMYEVSQALPNGQRSTALDEAIEHLVVLLSPFAPHIADEMWAGLGQTGFLYRHPWPTADPAVSIAEEVTLVVQVNGKVRDRLTVSADADPEAVKALALASPKVQEALAGREAAKIIVVPRRVVNVVTGRN